MKILVICVSIISTLAAGILTYYYFSPTQKAERAANLFMQGLLSSDTESTSLYFEITPENVYQRNYVHKATTRKGYDFYVLYRFTDDQPPSQLRVLVSSSKVKSAVAGSSLGRIPSEDRDEATSSEQKSDRCLTQDDLEFIDSRRIYARYIRGATMIFQPGTSNFQTSQGGGLLLDRMSDFYRKVGDKDYIYDLKGYMASDLSSETTEQRVDLFQKRAVRLQEELVDRDVPLDRISINPVYNYYDSTSTTLDNELYVDINIVNRCVDE